MRVKGTAYLARVKLLTEKLGDEGAGIFLDEYCRKHDDFPRSVLPTSLIPARNFLQFVDAIVERVYEGDRRSLWDLGRASAEWTLKEGPYKTLLELADFERFSTMASVLWSNFFDEGSARSKAVGHRVEVWIEGVPVEFRHPYFEYSAIGYFERGLELLGARVDSECVRGFDGGDEDIFYRLSLSR